MKNPYETSKQYTGTSETNPYVAEDPVNIKELKAAEEKGESWWEDPIMATRMVLDGMTLGWADEVGSAVAAAAVMLTPDVAKGKSFSQVYDEIHNSVRQEDKQYREDNPIASTALNVVGGFASPVNYVSLGSAQAGSLAKAGGMAIRGTAEGAAYGAGSAEQGQRGSGAVSGGLTGGLISGGLGSAGWLWSKTSSRKIAEDLLKPDGSFTPITMTQEADDVATMALKEGYRDIVGLAYGGHNKIAAQEQPFRTAAAAKVEAANDLLKRAHSSVKESMANLKEVMTGKSSALKYATKAQIEDLKKLAKTDAAMADDALKQFTNNVQAKALKDIDDAVEGVNHSFRLKALSSSMPGSATQEAIDQVLTARTPNQAMKLLDNLWQREGFKSIKDRKFRINPNKVISQIVKQLQDDPEFAVMAPAQSKAMITNISGYLQDRVAKGGWIDGDSLSALRSKIGMAAGKKSDQGGESAVIQSMFREMQDVLNGEIRKQLSGKGLKAFDQDISAWKSNLVTREAVGRASKTALDTGRFTPDDWVAAIAKNSKRDARYGEGPLAKTAAAAARLGRMRDATIKSGAEKIVRNEADRVASLNKAKAADIDRQIAGLKKQIEEAGRGNSSRLSKMEEQFKVKQNIDQLEKAKQEALDQADWVKRNASDTSASIFKRMIATGIAGEPIKAVLGTTFGIANLASGTVLSRGLASQKAQLAMAGQTATQRNMERVAEGMRTKLPETVGDIDIGQMMSRFLTRIGTTPEE